MFGDLKFVLRVMRRAPVVSAAAILTVAVAIGGAVSVFALFDAVLLKSLPYSRADRLVAVWVDYTKIADMVGVQDPKREWSNFDNHRDVRDRTRTLDGLAAFTGWVPTLVGDDETARLNGAMVTDNGLDVLGVTPQLGRGFLPGESGADATEVALIGHALWQRLFAGDPAVVGRTVTLNGEAFTIVGVLPQGFRFPFLPNAEIFAPIEETSDDRGAAYIRQFGRLADGETLEQAQAELTAIAAALKAEYPDDNRHLEHFVEPLQNALSLAVRPQLILLQSAALFVLLVATANLASLMVARAAARCGEFGIRSSLGATPWRHFRLLWTEGMAFAVVGAALGMLAAGWGVEFLTRAFPDGFAQAWDIRLDWRSWWVAGGFAVFAGSVIALASHLSLGKTVTAGARVAGRRGSGQLSGALVAVNFALALAVTVTSVLLYRSHERLAGADLGYDPQGVLAANVLLPEGAYPDRNALLAAYARIEDRVGAIPGVERVALSSSIPLGFSNTDTGVAIEGRPGKGDDGRVQTWFTRATPSYFEAMGIGVSAGRAFLESDAAEGREVAVINAAFARQHFGTDSPLGVRLNLGSDEQPLWLDIVGVVDDVRFFDVARPETPAMYIPAWRFPARGMYVTLKTARDPGSIVNEFRSAMFEVDPSLALSDLRGMEQRVTDSLTVPHTISRLTLVFAGCALLLAAIGVYGTLAQSVVQRTRELGVRRALGAVDRDVFRLVLKQGAVPVAIGAVLGLPLAWVLGRQLQTVLYEIAPTDPAGWAFALGTMLAVAFGAAALPGRRATRIKPMEALREE